MIIQQLVGAVLSVLIWVAVIGGILWLAGLRWRLFRHLQTGYFSIAKIMTLGIFNVLFKPTERRGIGNLVRNQGDPNDRA